MARRAAKLAVDPHDDAAVLFIWHNTTDPNEGRQPVPRVHEGHFFKAMNPQTGLEAVWLPGEIVPEWAWSDEMAEQVNQRRTAANSSDQSTLGH